MPMTARPVGAREIAGTPSSTSRASAARPRPCLLEVDRCRRGRGPRSAAYSRCFHATSSVRGRRRRPGPSVELGERSTAAGRFDEERVSERLAAMTATRTRRSAASSTERSARAGEPLDQPGQRGAARARASADRSISSSNREPVDVSVTGQGVRQQGHATSLAACAGSGCALAQLNTASSATSTATSSVSSSASKAAEADGCDLVVFPELAITGYPPEDLLLKPSFVADNRRRCERVAAPHRAGASASSASSTAGDASLYNAAAVCAAGTSHGIYRKRRLPNYAVFDEQRYFAPGADRPTPLRHRRGASRGVDLRGRVEPRTARSPRQAARRRRARRQPQRARRTTAARSQQRERDAGRPGPTRPAARSST